MVTNSCQSVLGALELKSLQLILDMGTGSINSSSNVSINTVTPKPLVEQHIIQNCAVSSLDSMLSAKLREEDNPELEKLIRKFPDLFTEGVGIYSGDSHRIHLSLMLFPHDSRYSHSASSFCPVGSQQD